MPTDDRRELDWALAALLESVPDVLEPLTPERRAEALAGLASLLDAAEQASDGELTTRLKQHATRFGFLGDFSDRFYDPELRALPAGGASRGAMLAELRALVDRSR